MNVCLLLPCNGGGTFLSPVLPRCGKDRRPSSFGHVGFPRSREYWKTKRMDSRFHGNDGNAFLCHSFSPSLPLLSSFPRKRESILVRPSPPSVIPAEAGIHPPPSFPSSFRHSRANGNPSRDPSVCLCARHPSCHVRIDSRFRGNDKRRAGMTKTQETGPHSPPPNSPLQTAPSVAPSVLPLLQSFPRKRESIPSVRPSPPSVIPVQTGIPPGIPPSVCVPDTLLAT